MMNDGSRIIDDNSDDAAASTLLLWQAYRIGVSFVYIIAISSHWSQSHGVCGPNGLYPINEAVNTYYKHFGWKCLVYKPSIFLLLRNQVSNRCLDIVCFIGIISSVLSIAATINLIPASLIYNFIPFIIHLSFINVVSRFIGKFKSRSSFVDVCIILIVGI